MVVMVPTDEFRQHQLSRLPRAGAISRKVSDPDLAQRNRIARDRLIADDAVTNARRLNIRIIGVEGSRDAHAVPSMVADHFYGFLP
jgi:hypothetical protein